MQSIHIKISEKDGESRDEVFAQETITLGRIQGNDIVLARGNISKRHSRIVFRDNRVIVVDLKSTNGTYVNGKRINAPQVIQEGDKVYLGDFILDISLADPKTEAVSIRDLEAPSAPGVGALGGQASGAPELPADGMDDLFELDEAPGQAPEVTMGGPQPSPEPLSGVGATGASEELSDLLGGNLDIDFSSEGSALSEVKARAAEEPYAAPAEPEPVSPSASASDSGLNDLFDEDSEALDLKLDGMVSLDAPTPPNVGSDDLDLDLGLDDDSTPDDLFGDPDPNPASGFTDDLASLEDPNHVVAPQSSPAASLSQEDLIQALGELGRLANNDAVKGLWVQEVDPIVVRPFAGDVRRVDGFASKGAFEKALSALKKAGEKTGEEDSGSQQVQVPGVRGLWSAVDLRGVGGQAVISFSRGINPSAGTSLVDLVRGGTMSKRMAKLLDATYQKQCNILILATNPVDSAVLARTLVQRTPKQAFALVGDAHARVSSAELLNVDNVSVSHQSRDAALGTMLDVRPDHLIWSSLSAEAPLLLDGIVTGQSGVVAMLNATNASTGLETLIDLVRARRANSSPRALRRQWVEAFDLIVTISRFADGVVRITEMVEPTGTEMDIVSTQELFSFKLKSSSASAIQGDFVSHGQAPTYYDRLNELGFEMDMSIFRA